MASDPSKRATPHLGAPASAGAQYGKYFLVRKLAEGGMAEIFLAKALGAEGFERNVVIKRMLPHLSEVADFVGMFLDEARLAARLSHPNVVQIHDLGLADGCYYICMEYLAGEDFSTLLRTAAKQRQYVPFSIAARVIHDAALGLHFAHEFTDDAGVRLNIVHRDISPSNIYVTYQGQVKVLDFGIAKAETRITQTSAGVVKGKYMYMAPEQARGEPVDRRADVFSLGVSLYEAVTLTRPFAKENDLAILNAVLRNDFVGPTKLRPDLPLTLEHIILKAMAGKVDERYATAGAMASDLARFLASDPSHANPGVAPYLMTLFGEERRVSKTRIPSLSALLPREEARKPLTDGGPIRTPTDVNTLELSALTTAVPPPSSASMASGKPRSGAWKWVALGVGLLALAGGGAFLFHRTTTAVPSPTVAAQPSLQPPAPAPVVTPPPSPAVTPPPTAPPASASAGTVAAAPVASTTATPPPAVDRPAAEHPAAEHPAAEHPAAEHPAAEHPAAEHPHRRLQQLDVRDVERIISGGRGSMQRCFESYREQLPSNRTELKVHLTIFGSGKVAAETLDDFKGTPVGSCIEERVKRLHFPPHRDKEVSFVLPLAFHTAGGP